jgi:hypothetical protein
VTPEEARVAFMQVTGFDQERMDNFLSLPPDLQRDELQNYADQDWSDPSTPAGARLLEILGAIGGVGSDVENAAGAAAGVKSL